MLLLYKDVLFSYYICMMLLLYQDVLFSYYICMMLLLYKDVLFSYYICMLLLYKDVLFSYYIFMILLLYKDVALCIQMRLMPHMWNYKQNLNNMTFFILFYLFVLLYSDLIRKRIYK